MRGCICGPDLAVIALKIVKKGDAEIDGLTTDVKPRRLGPKRASYIRKVFALRKNDDVRKYVVRREVKKGDKTFYKSPKIQRLITEKRLRRKKLIKRAKQDRFKKSKDDKAKYDKILSKYIKEKKAQQEQTHPEGAPAKGVLAGKPEEKKTVAEHKKSVAQAKPGQPTASTRVEIKKDAPKIAKDAEQKRPANVAQKQGKKVNK